MGLLHKGAGRPHQYVRRFVDYAPIRPVDHAGAACCEFRKMMWEVL